MISRTGYDGNRAEIFGAVIEVAVERAVDDFADHREKRDRALVCAGGRRAPAVAREQAVREDRRIVGRCVSPRTGDGATRGKIRENSVVHGQRRSPADADECTRAAFRLVIVYIGEFAVGYLATEVRDVVVCADYNCCRRCAAILGQLCGGSEIRDLRADQTRIGGAENDRAITSSVRYHAVGHRPFECNCIYRTANDTVGRYA